MSPTVPTADLAELYVDGAYVSGQLLAEAQIGCLALRTAMEMRLKGNAPSIRLLQAPVTDPTSGPERPTPDTQAPPDSA